MSCDQEKAKNEELRLKAIIDQLKQELSAKDQRVSHLEAEAAAKEDDFWTKGEDMDGDEALSEKPEQQTR